MKFPWFASALCGALLAFPAFAGLININTADADSLATLPGVGPAKAGAIIEYRSANGPFKSVEQLEDVQGFGEKLIARLRELVTVGE